MLTELAGNVRLTAEMVRTIHDRARAGESQADLAREFGINRATACRIAQERTWTHLWERLPYHAPAQAALRANGRIVGPVPKIGPTQRRRSSAGAPQKTLARAAVELMHKLRPGANEPTAMEAARALKSRGASDDEIITAMISVGIDQDRIRKIMRALAAETPE